GIELVPPTEVPPAIHRRQDGRDGRCVRRAAGVCGGSQYVVRIVEQWRELALRHRRCAVRLIGRVAPPRRVLDVKRLECALELQMAVLELDTGHAEAGSRAIHLAHAELL